MELVYVYHAGGFLQLGCAELEEVGEEVGSVEEEVVFEGAETSGESVGGEKEVEK